MRFKKIKKLALSVMFCAPVLAQAEEIGVYAKGGTLGLGGGVGYAISDAVIARVGYTALDFDGDIDTDDVDYDADFKLGGGELMLDWHPFSSSFRITAGAIFNRNEIDVDAKLNQEVTINDIVYQASDIGTLGGNVEFDSTSPYFGIGWGKVAGKDGKFHFVADIGVQYQGSPDVNLQGTCSASFAANNPVECSQLDDNISRQEQDLEDEVSDYEWWPVISIGFAYRF